MHRDEPNYHEVCALTYMHNSHILVHIMNIQAIRDVRGGAVLPLRRKLDSVQDLHQDESLVGVPEESTVHVFASFLLTH